MFEDNKYDMEDLDFGFKSVLEDAQEDVPAQVWDRIDAELDRISRRRVAVLWFRRAAIGAAMAAAVATGVFFGGRSSDDLVLPGTGSDAIALVTPDKGEATENGAAEMDMKEAQPLVAMAMKPARNIVKPSDKEDEVVAASAGFPDTDEAGQADEPVANSQQGADGKSRQEAGNGRPKAEEQAHETFPDVWPDDEHAKKRIKTSLVISGITSTNSAQNGTKVNPMKRPAITAVPKKTGVKETSTNSTYGIPASAGLGVRLDLTPRWSLGIGLNYTLLTRKFYGTYTQVGSDGNITKDISSDIRNTQHYLGIPVNAYYNIVRQDHINFYVYAGGAAEKCIRDSYQILNTDITHRKKAEGLQYSANAGLGVEFLTGRHGAIYLDPSLRYYFDCGQPKSIRTVQPLMLGFEVGFRIRL
jgi:hypothetical protein